MKRWKYLVLALIGVLLFSFAACAEGDTEEEKTPSVTLSASSAALDLYETICLTARAENTDGPVVWSSSDPSRATVEDGLVTALAVGNNVRITASAGGASAVCVVTITDSQAAPVLSVSESSVRLAEGESFTVTASVQLKGEPVQNVSYRWAGGDAFASVQAEGAQAVIFGLSEGETEIYVSATVRGIYVAQRIFVAVRSLDIVLDLANCKPGGSGTYAAQLYTLDAEGYEASFTPALTVYENGIAVPDPQLQWESKNSAVVRVENNETLAAVSAGSTQVVCRYKQESIAIDVTVSRTRLPLSGSAVAELHVLKPITIEGEISGEVTTIADAMSDLVLMILLAVVFIYLIMVAQFQSLLSPFIVMFTVPLAFTGGLIGLLITGQQLSLMSLMGFIVMMGTVVNNGIVFVDYTNQLRIGGMDRRAALIATGKTRMRPILMTALTTILAMFQMLFSDDMASQLMSGMAIVIIGGLLYATFMTLYIVPVMYEILFRRPPLQVDVGGDDLDDVPDDAAEFIAAALEEHKNQGGAAPAEG